MFAAQRGVAQKLGPTVDYIRFDVLLAQAEASLDASASETRLLTVFYDITQLTDLESRVQAWAWFIAGLNEIATAGRAGSLRILISDSTKKLEESFVALLYATADHRRVAKDVVLTVARWDIAKAIEFAGMLNTEARRDDVLVQLARNVMLDGFPAQAPDRIKEIVLAIKSPNRRDASCFVGVGHSLQKVNDKQRSYCPVSVFTSRGRQDCGCPYTYEDAPERLRDTGSRKWRIA